MERETDQETGWTAPLRRTGEDPSRDDGDSDKANCEQQVTRDARDSHDGSLLPYVRLPASQTTGQTSYRPIALTTSHSTSTAVTPWKPYQGSTFALKAEDLPRNTSAMIERIQPADTSHTIAAAIHQSIRLHSFPDGSSKAYLWQTLIIPGLSCRPQNPNSRPRMAACVREVTSSLRRICTTWLLTVSGVM